MPASHSLNLFDVSDGMGFYIGRDIQTKLHTHHALEIVVALSEPYIIETAEGESIQTVFSVVAPDVPHLFTGSEGIYIFIFLDPQLRLAKQLADRLKALPHGILDEAEPLYWNFANKVRYVVQEFFATSSFTPDALYQTLADLSLSPQAAEKEDARILQATNFILASLHEDISLEKIASHVFLSPSRFAHLFRQQTGVPFRRYVLWCRMQVALRNVLQGESFTNAATEAGFADVAHLSRTFSEMFGVSPSSVLKQ